MTAPNPFRCFVMGNESLLVQCAEVLRAEGHKILGVITSNPEIEAWASQARLKVLAPGKDLAERVAHDPLGVLRVTHAILRTAKRLASPARAVRRPFRQRPMDSIHRSNSGDGRSPRISRSAALL